MAETDESTNEAEEEGREGLGGPHFVDEEFNGGTDYPLPPPRGGIISLLFSSFRPSRGGGMGISSVVPFAETKGRSRADASSRQPRKKESRNGERLARLLPVPRGARELSSRESRNEILEGR